MTSTRTALVIGAGIAGPVTAMALRKVGIDPVVYEAHPSTAEGIGTFLTLGSNGVDALRVLDADAPALAAGFPTPSITLRSGTGRRLGESRLCGSSDGTTSQTMKRPELYRVLHAEAQARGVRIERGRRLVAAEDTGDGVRATFADGSQARGDLLIGCDGVHSTVRGIIDPGAPAPDYAGLLTLGGYATGVPVDSEPGSYEMIFGRRGFFGYAAAPDGQVWWFANVPRRDEPTRGELDALDGEQWRALLLDLFATDAGPAVPLIEATPDIAPAQPIHTIGHLPAWHNDRMIVIGDAAHAPSPSSGQGASLSIEDAVMLARSLRDLPGPAEAFTRFTAARRPRAEGIIRRAAKINNNKAAGPVARVFRDAMLPLVLKLTADTKEHRRVFDYHIDWDTSAAPAASGASSGRPS